MELLEFLSFDGPNVWTYLPVLEVLVGLGDLAGCDPEAVPGFTDRLLAWLPMLAGTFSHTKLGGVARRVRSTNNLAHAMERVTLALQKSVGSQVRFARTTPDARPGIYHIAVQCEEPSLGRACVQASQRIVLAALKNELVDVAAETKQLSLLADQVCLGPSTRAIVQAALARGIPVRRLNTDSLVQLGHGVHQRRICAAESDRTGAIAESIAQDKQLTKQLLRSVGVPVPEGRPVVSPADAWAAAQEIEPPVVVKPRDGNHGRGVFAGLTTREQIEAAYHHAAQEAEDGVIVERFARGTEHRLLVVGGRVVAAARGDHAQIIGDGIHSVAELIESQINSDPRRGGEEDDLPLMRIDLDPITMATLREQNVSPDSIPDAGQIVLVKHNGNLSIDVTDDVHPEVAARAVEAARTVGLDIAGLDIVVDDISAPLESQGGVVVEVNAGPGLQMHLEPSHGKPRPVGEAIVELLFPGDQTGRIPIVCVTGTHHSCEVAEQLARLLGKKHHRAGLATSKGQFVGSRQLFAGDATGADATRDLLINPLVKAVVVETTVESILHTGLGFDFCDVLVITGIEPHLDRQTRSALNALIISVSATGTAVLPAGNHAAQHLATHCAGKVIYAATNGTPRRVPRRYDATVFANHEHIKLAEHGRERAIFTSPRLHEFDLSVLVPVAAAAWALHVPCDSP